MELVYDTEAVKAFYAAKSEQFLYLANYLNICKYLLERPIKETIDAGPFPPIDENYKIFFDKTNLDENKPSIELASPYLSPDENSEIFSEKINSNDMTELPKEDFNIDEFNLISLDVYFEYIRQGKMIIKNINFNEYKSFAILSDFCLLISGLYGSDFSQEYILSHIGIIEKVDTMAHLITGKAYELIGYWKAKMEEKRRNFMNTKPKTLKRKTIEEAIKDLLKNNEYKPTKRLVIEAQKVTDRGERTIKNILKTKNITEYIKNNISK